MAMSKVVISKRLRKKKLLFSNEDFKTCVKKLNKWHNQKCCVDCLTLLAVLLNHLPAHAYTAVFATRKKSKSLRIYVNSERLLQALHPAMIVWSIIHDENNLTKDESLYLQVFKTHWDTVCQFVPLNVWTSLQKKLENHEIN